jgi:hypothetical protein
MRAFAFLIGLLMALPAYSQEGASPAELTLFQLANQRRAEQGIPPLAWDAALARAAHAHAERMSHAQNEPQHQYPGEADLPTRAAQAGAHFSKVSENIAAANTKLSDIEQGWMDSPSHRAAILDPQLNAIGIAVVENQNMIYAVEDFSHANPTLSREAIEAQAQKALRARGLQVETSEPAKQAARNSCDASNTKPPAGALAAMQFDCTDLNQFPDIVLKGLPEVKEHPIAVASCGTPLSREGFTTYHLAVLMFSGSQ